jgi:hypothetical protein
MGPQQMVEAGGRGRPSAVAHVTQQHLCGTGHGRGCIELVGAGRGGGGGCVAPNQDLGIMIMGWQDGAWSSALDPFGESCPGQGALLV